MPAIVRIFAALLARQWTVLIVALSTQFFCIAPIDAAIPPRSPSPFAGAVHHAAPPSAEARPWRLAQPNPGAAAMEKKAEVAAQKKASKAKKGSPCAKKCRARLQGCVQVASGFGTSIPLYMAQCKPQMKACMTAC